MSNPVNSPFAEPLRQLIADLAHAQEAVERMVGQAIDAVVDPATGRTFMLSGAQDAYVRLQRETAAQAEQLRLAANVFAHAHEGILITDAKGVIVDVNDMFVEITGFSREEAIGKTPRRLRSIHHDHAFSVSAMWRAIVNPGYWHGSIWNKRKNGEEYLAQLTIAVVRTPEGGISHFVGTFSDVTLLHEQQQRLKLLAHYDPLTQLPNRALLTDRFQQALAQAQRANTLLAIGYLDLDGFKAINDNLGHDAGDRLLIEVAQRIKQHLRSGDTVARFGGDEFVLLLPGLDSIHACTQILARLLQTVAEPYRLHEQTIQVSASIGVAFFPHDGSDPDALLRQADQAMYRAKQLGRNRYHLFEP